MNYKSWTTILAILIEFYDYYTDENDIYKMLSEWNLANDVTLDELKSMGWNGRISCNAKIIPFNKK